jgi:iron complex outermembrane receptor protein
MKYQKLICNSLIGLMGTTALAGFTTVAYAADATGNPAALEEITVTATKRVEKLQDVPDSIKVFSAADLEHANVTNLRGFVQLTPNLIVRETFRSNETFLTMRGLSSAQGALPPVAFVVDGIQLGSNDFINQDLLDIERIEVLRGPQGALYGQGAIAGAINVVTKQPTNELSGMAKGTYGNANTYRIAGSVSGPLVKDMLFAKVSGYYKKSDGLIKNNAGVRTTPYDQTYGRGQLTYKNEKLSINAFGSYTNGKSYCCIQDIAQKEFNGVIYPGWTSTGTLPQYVIINTDQVTGSPGPTSNILGKSWDRFASAGMKLDYDFDAFTATAIAGYSYVRQHIYGDADYTASGPTQIAQDIYYTTKIYNQELRFTSRGDGPFKWLFGGYHNTRKDDQNVLVGLDPGAPLNQGPGNITTLVLHQDNVNNSHSYAFYTSMSYDITEKWQLSGAIRYDNDSQNAVNTLAANSNKAHVFKKAQPKVQLSYKWNPDVLVYTSYSVGFRSGGYSQNSAFKDEKTQNYELGFKSTLFDGLAVLNAAFFHIDYDNQQISFVQLQPVVLKKVVNIDKTKIDGMEVELTARPVDNLTVSLGAGLSDSTIKKASANALTAGLDLNGLIGNKSPLVAALTFNASVNYTLPLADNFDMLFHADWRREGGYYFDVANTIKTGTHDLISGKIAVEKDSWSVGVWGQNLTNARYATNVGVTGTPYRFPNQPRSYGVEASFKF